MRSTVARGIPRCVSSRQHESAGVSSRLGAGRTARPSNASRSSVLKEVCDPDQGLKPIACVLAQGQFRIEQVNVPVAEHRCAACGNAAQRAGILDEHGIHACFVVHQVQQRNDDLKSSDEDDEVPARISCVRQFDFGPVARTRRLSVRKRWWGWKGNVSSPIFRDRASFQLSRIDKNGDGRVGIDHSAHDARQRWTAAEWRNGPREHGLASFFNPWRKYICMTCCWSNESFASAASSAATLSDSSSGATQIGSWRARFWRSCASRSRHFRTPLRTATAMQASGSSGWTPGARRPVNTFCTMSRAASSSRVRESASARCSDPADSCRRSTSFLFKGPSFQSAIQSLPTVIRVRCSRIWPRIPGNSANVPKRTPHSSSGV